MQVDSNILIAILRGESGAHVEYARAAMGNSVTVCSEIVSETTARMLRLERMGRKCEGKEFGKLSEERFNREIANEILSMIKDGSLLAEQSYICPVLDVMCTAGLDYADCLLYYKSLISSQEVATSDKALAALLADMHWKAPALV